MKPEKIMNHDVDMWNFVYCLSTFHSLFYREGLRAKKRVTKLVLAVTAVFIGIIK